MARLNIDIAYIFSKRSKVRDVVRQSLKKEGLETGNIHNVTTVKEALKGLDENPYSFLILDWEIGPDLIQEILVHIHKTNHIESHPTYLLAGKEDDKIIEVAKEYYLFGCDVGDVKAEKIQAQMFKMVSESRDLSPVRQVLLNVEQLRREGNDSAVHDSLERLLVHYPDNARILSEAAESYIVNGEWKTAEILLKPLIRKEPSNARIKHTYARCCLKGKKFDEAISVLEEANVISPYNVERLMDMGDIFLELNEIDKATKAYDEILKFAPDAVSAKKGKSTSLLLAGDFSSALSILNSFSTKRELSTVFNTAAILAISKHEFGQGFALYKKALNLLKGNDKLLSRIIFNMGIAFYKKDDMERSVQCFEKASALDPNFKKAAFNVAAMRKINTQELLNVYDGAASEKARPSIDDALIDESSDDFDTSFEDDIKGLGGEGSADDELDLDGIFDDDEGFEL